MRRIRRREEESQKPPVLKPIRGRVVKGGGVTYRTLLDFNKDLKLLLDKLPTDIDLVAGIPRCGMLPATLISLYWNLPLTDVHSLREGRMYPHHKQPKRYTLEKTKKVLVVDDSVASGGNIKSVKSLLRGLNYTFVYAAVYVTEKSGHHVDHYARVVPWPRFFEHDITLSPFLAAACCDIDGVLCRNPTRGEQSTPEKLSHFYKTVNPWIRPPWVDTLVTRRLERYRPETEAWLEGHGIRYNKLIMQPVKGDDRLKVDYYKSTGHELFVESSPQEAEAIRQTGKQVIVPYPQKGHLKILAQIKAVPRPAGASITFCTAAAALARRGHDVTITRAGRNLSHIPEQARALMREVLLQKAYADAHIVLVHWRSSAAAVEMARRVDRPRIHFFCDPGSHQRLGVTHCALTVYNSKWIQEKDAWPGDSMVLYPPVYPELYKTTPGAGILLIAPIPTKGIDMFLALAERMPDREFVIARGRGDEVKRLLPNIKVIPNVEDPRDIYSKARLVLMPSRPGRLSIGGKSASIWVEGYGRVAIEAAASGIPTIGSRESVGLQECLGPGGMFAGQDNIEEWVDLIEMLDDKDFYAEKSQYALMLSAERHPDLQIDELEERLVAICNRA